MLRGGGGVRGVWGGGIAAQACPLRYRAQKGGIIAAILSQIAVGWPTKEFAWGGLVEWNFQSREARLKHLSEIEIFQSLDPKAPEPPETEIEILIFCPFLWP